MAAYYNEIDKFNVDWLRYLIACGQIPDGVVDDRSIVDVRPADLAGFTQCHFFAGIAGWALALDLAGWPRDRPVWTGSCPCQPLSSAGQRKGHADERHLWPAFFNLIAECRPAIIFGEQVASPLGREWLSAVRLDLEGAGHAVGAADLPAAGVGAFHKRQRLFWMAHAERSGWRGRAGTDRIEEGEGQRRSGPSDCGGMGDADGDGRQSGRTAVSSSRHRHSTVATGDMGDAGREGLSSRQSQDLCGEGRGSQGRAAEQPGAGSGAARDAVADAAGRGRGEFGHAVEPGNGGHPDGGILADALADADGQRRDGGSEASRPEAGTGAGPDSGGNSFWSDVEWIACSDGKARPAKPGIFPLAARVPGDVGKLRGAGNAIVPQVAQAFIEAVMEVLP